VNEALQFVGLRRLLTGDFVALDRVRQRTSDDVVLRDVDQRVEEHVAVSHQDYQRSGNAVETRSRHLQRNTAPLKQNEQQMRVNA